MRTARANRRTSAGVVLLLAIALAACAPRLEPPGPSIAVPRFDGNTFLTADGANLPVRTWAPDAVKPKAALIALHGFNDYGHYFAEPGSYLAKKGIVSYAYDQRGFGRAPHRGLWPGVDAFADDAAAFIRLVRARHPGLPVYLLGTSMGGSVALVAMTRANPPKVNGLILTGPAVWARRTMPWYQRLALSIAAHTVPWMTVTGRGLDIKPSDNIAMLRKLSRDPLVIKETRIDAIHGLANLMDESLAVSKFLRAPALVLYGEKDEIIPPGPTFEMFRHIRRAANPDQKIAVYPHGYHMLLRDLQAATVLDDIAAWIVNRHAALPSGADKRALKIIAHKK
ncbi:MAG: alpha/beta hydrolase [Rhodospirillales bacterium]